MCKCKKPEVKLERTEKHCDHVLWVYSDGKRVKQPLRCS